MINTDRTAKPTDAVAWQERVRSNGRADAKSFGLGNGVCHPINAPYDVTLQVFKKT